MTRIDRSISFGVGAAIVGTVVVHGLVLPAVAAAVVVFLGADTGFHSHQAHAFVVLVVKGGSFGLATLATLPALWWIQPGCGAWSRRLALVSGTGTLLALVMFRLLNDLPLTPYFHHREDWFFSSWSEPAHVRILFHVSLGAVAEATLAVCLATRDRREAVRAWRAFALAWVALAAVLYEYALPLAAIATLTGALATSALGTRSTGRGPDGRWLTAWYGSLVLWLVCVGTTFWGICSDEELHSVVITR